MQQNIRNPAVAGAFYPADPSELNTLLAELFEKTSQPSSQPTPKAFIVPHAGYRFSGQVAAQAFRTLEGRRIRTAVLLGNAHAALFDGIAIDPHDGWRTPLGTVPLDEMVRTRLIELDPTLYHQSDIAHRRDHVLEVQLPLLQHALPPGFKILPLLFGQNPAGTYRQCAEALLPLLSNDDLLIASSDLSHYPTYHDAQAIDPQTLEHMVRLDIQGLEQHEKKVIRCEIPSLETLFCGTDAIKTVLEIGRRLGWKSELLDYRNSGDADHASREAVVGYGAVMFTAP